MFSERHLGNVAVMCFVRQEYFSLICRLLFRLNPSATPRPKQRATFFLVPCEPIFFILSFFSRAFVLVPLRARRTILERGSTGQDPEVIEWRCTISFRRGRARYAHVHRQLVCEIHSDGVAVRGFKSPSCSAHGCWRRARYPCIHGYNSSVVYEITWVV